MQNANAKPETIHPRTLEAKLRKWLEIARPAWSYPLDKEEVACLLGEIDRLRGSLKIAGEGDGAL